MYINLTEQIQSIDKVVEYWTYWVGAYKRDNCFVIGMCRQLMASAGYMHNQ